MKKYIAAVVAFVVMTLGGGTTVHAKQAGYDETAHLGIVESKNITYNFWGRPVYNVKVSYRNSNGRRVVKTYQVSESAYENCRRPMTLIRTDKYRSNSDGELKRVSRTTYCP